MTEYILPPELDKKLYEKAQEAGLSAHRAIRATGATRVDLIIDEEGAIYILEVNTIPGMTETSLLPKIASLTGMDFTALVEAMALAKPIVASRVGGVTDLISEGVNGILVPPAAPELLAAEIVKLLNDFSLAQQLGENGREKVYPAFDIATRIAKIEALYHKLINQTNWPQ